MFVKTLCHGPAYSPDLWMVFLLIPENGTVMRFKRMKERKMLEYWAYKAHERYQSYTTNAIVNDKHEKINVGYRARFDVNAEC